MAVQYCKENNTNRIPANYVIGDIKLGSWYNTQLSFFNKKKLSDEKINLFRKAGLSLIGHKEENWWNNYQLLIEYYETTPDKTVSYALIFKGVNLGSWCIFQRKKFRNNSLSQEKIDALTSIGFPFIESPLDTQWLKNFNAVKKFFEQTGGNYIPMHTVVDGIDIWYWGRNQKTLQHKGKLPKDRLKLLESINFSFDEPKCMGSSLEESVLFYYIQKIFPNAKQRDRTNDFELDIYFEYNNQKIGIEYDGSHYHKDLFSRDLEKVKKCKKANITLFEIRYKSCGSLQKNTSNYYEYLLEKDYKGIYKSDEYQAIIKQVISDLCRILKINFSIDISVKKDMDEITKLYAKSYNQRWLNRYEIFKDFIINNRVMPTRNNSDKSLYSWCRNQLTAYREKRLTIQQIELLEKLIPYGFWWSNSPDKINAWEEKYNILIEYKKTYNHASPIYNEIYKEVRLGKWVSRQRTAYKNGTLSSERIEKLEAIGFLWESPNKKGKKGVV